MTPDEERRHAEAVALGRKVAPWIIGGAALTLVLGAITLGVLLGIALSGAR